MDGVIPGVLMVPTQRRRREHLEEAMLQWRLCHQLPHGARLRLATPRLNQCDRCVALLQFHLAMLEMVWQWAAQAYIVVL